MPDVYAQRALDFISKLITSTQHIEFYLRWSKCLLTIHGATDGKFKHQTLLSIQDSITRKYELLNKICDFNKYTLQVLIESMDAKKQSEDTVMKAVRNGDGSDDDDEDSEEEDYILLDSRRHRKADGQQSPDADDDEDDDDDE